MLQLFLGRTGYGKTRHIKNIIKESAEKKEIIFLVPDQMSFNVERDIAEFLPAQKAEKVKVYTFSKLAEDVFRNYGGISEKRINENGRNLLMSLAINDCIDELNIYKSSAKYGRLTKLMLDTVKEFKACQITASDLDEVAKTSGNTLKPKLKEIAVIYQAFSEKLENSYIEPWDLLTRASEVLKEKTGDILNQKDYFKDKIMVIDGFEGFDKEKYSILQCAIEECDVYATLCCEDIYSEEVNSIFSLLNDTGKSLVSIAKKTNAVCKITKLAETAENPVRFENNELKILEKNIFSSSSTEKIEANNITIYKASDLYKETQYVAATIRNLIMQGYKYGDINVICSDSSKYVNIIESVFKNYEIPVFITKPRMVDGAPIIRLVLTALKIATFGFKTADILTLMKTKLCGLNDYQISKLENYVYTWRIEGNQWVKEFKKSAYGYGSKGSDKTLESIEKSRKMIIEPLIAFSNTVKEASVLDISKAIYNLLVVDYKSDKELRKHYNQLKLSGMLEEAQEQVKIWEELMATLDQFVGILAENKMTAKLYTSMLKDVLAKQEIMDIPLKLDSVMVSTSNQIKNKGKITFLLGCVLEEFPRIPNGDAIFTLHEKKQLSENSFIKEVNFIKKIEQEILLERFYAYTSALSCSEKLYVSYDGTLIPSEIIAEIQRIFDVEVLNDLPLSYFTNSYASVFSAAARLYRETTVESETFKSIVKDNEQLKEDFEKIKKSVNKKELVIENKEASQTLFKKEYLSPTQIDDFYKCKFGHFCKHGLKLKEQRVAEVNLMNYGTIMHYVFEKILKEKYNSTNTSTTYDLKSKIKKYIIKYAHDEMGGYTKLDPRDKYRLNRIETTANVLTQRIIDEIEQSDFKPKYLELEIIEKNNVSPQTNTTKQEKFKLLEIDVDKYTSSENAETESKKTYVGGKVDRADVCTINGKTYIRVIDYKTGKKEFKIDDVSSGMNLQMLIYLAALSEAKDSDGNNRFEPAAVLYMQSAYPSILVNRSEKISTADEKRRGMLCMNGLLIDDNEVIKAMEAKREGKYIPITTSNTESLKSKEYLHDVFEYIKKLIAKMSVDLNEGDIDTNPLMAGENACKFCDYKVICLQERDEETPTEVIKFDEIIETKEVR